MISNERYADFLVSRLLSANDFGSTEKLLSAIDEANELQVWREQKNAFNLIAERAPMKTLNTDGFCIKYTDLAAFIRQECAAMAQFKMRPAR